ncbi:MAG: LysR family transcriptional regulator [Firmicutes bacterium]|nr:LysR family transcriptional regulator [Bacillota bacterium]
MEKINAEVFITVAELGSFKKAADKLGYTQAGISYIINSMEEQAGFRLFEREFGGVRLTQEGRTLLPAMQRLHRDEQIVGEQVDQIKGLERGRIRVLSINTVIVCYLPDILSEFKEQYPGIEIELSECDSHEKATRLILDSEADCTFTQLVASDKIQLIPLCRQEDMIVVSKKHPLARRKVFPISELGDHPYIGCTEALDPYNYDLARKFDVSLNQIIEINNDYGCFSMINKGLGFGIYPKIMVEKSTFPVKGIPFDVNSFTDISLGFRSYDSLSLAARAFVDFVKGWEF